jgi:hypothetical protein
MDSARNMPVGMTESDMKRKNYLILGISALANVWLPSPSLMAQMDAPIQTHPTLNDKANDRAITANAKLALTSDKNTSGATDAIHVQTSGGIVTLTGDVASQATAERAQTVVAQLSGVRDVVNDLKYPHIAGRIDSTPAVAPPASLGEVGIWQTH